MNQFWKECIALGVSLSLMVLSVGTAISLVKTGKVDVHFWWHNNGEVASDPAKLGLEIGQASGTWNVKLRY